MAFDLSDNDPTAFYIQNAESAASSGAVHFVLSNTSIDV